MPRLPKLFVHSQWLFSRSCGGVDGKRRDYNFGRDRQKAKFLYNQFIADCCQSLNTPQLTRAVASPVTELAAPTSGKKFTNRRMPGTK